MELTTGAIVDGKVKSLASFGAFISLPEGKTGLVHISEVSNTFVSNIRDHLSEGQNVRVKILSVGPTGKISLSIRRAQAQSKAQEPGAGRRPAPQSREPQTFEEKLKQFMSDADSRLSTNRLYADHRTKTRRR